MHLADARLHITGQAQVIHFVEQGSVQFAAKQFGMGQGASVENRIAFATGGHQVGLGQHLQMVAHAGLADGEDLRQLQYPERIVGQCAQYVQAQRIASGLAQGSQFIAVVRTQGGHG